jgi:hypothetical protein
VLILVERFSTRWVLSALFPIMATIWLGFLVFLLPRDDMGGHAALSFGDVFYLSDNC